MAFEGTPSSNHWQSGVDALRLGRVEEAIAHLSAFVQAHPHSFEGNGFLGVALAQAGRYPEAIAYLLQATRLNPQSARAHFNLGLAQMKAQQHDAARTAFQTALQIDPHYAPAQQALERLPASTPPPAMVTTPTESTAPPSWTEPIAAQKPAAATASDAMTTTDLLRAAAFGIAAALLGAVVWDKFVYYTNFKLSLIAVFLGIAVGIAVSVGAQGKTSTSLQWLGGVLAGLGILFGEVLLFKDSLQDYAAKEMNTSVGFLPALRITMKAFPSYLAEGGITILGWLFIAFGIYEGWKIPGRGGTGK